MNVNLLLLVFLPCALFKEDVGGAEPQISFIFILISLPLFIVFQRILIIFFGNLTRIKNRRDLNFPNKADWPSPAVHSLTVFFAFYAFPLKHISIKEQFLTFRKNS